MAINIFDTDVPDYNENSASDLSVIDEMRYALETFQAALKIRGIGRYLKDHTAEHIIYGVDKTTHEPKTYELEQQVDVSQILPMLYFNTKTNERAPLLPTSEVHVLNNYVKNVSPEDLDAFMLEVEGLKDLIYEKDQLEEADQQLNMSIYPHLKTYIKKNSNDDGYNNNYISKHKVTRVVQSIYEMIIQMNVDEIIEGTVDEDTIDLSQIDKAQDINYQHAPIHFKTKPIQTRLED